MSNEDKKEEDKNAEIDVLDQVRKVEKIIKMNLLMKSIANLKKMAREIVEIKEESRMLLEDIGIDEKDIKRIIDFVNECPDVKLTDEDKKRLRDKVRNTIKSNKEEIKKKIDEFPMPFNDMGMKRWINNSTTDFIGNSPAGASTGALYSCTLSNEIGGNVVLKI